SADELALNLVAQVHARGMRIIFDGVFNHMGSSSFAFQDLLQRQQDSPYADWFIVKSWRNEATGTPFDYDGWFGVESLPAFREASTGIVQGPRDYIFAAVERWMNPKGQGCAHGIDGWRLDVAWDVGHPFWKRFRTHVKTINPQAYLTAEIVAPPEQVTPYLQGDEFDGEMNYNFAFAAAEFLFDPGPNRITATQFDQRLRELHTRYPAGVAYVVQNLFGSHDSNRIGSHIRNRGRGNFRDWGNYFGASQAANHPDYDTRKPTEHDLRLQRLFAVLQMTSVGAPMIYYGDEVGLWGANDPDCRKPKIWPDIVYEPERTNPDGTPHAPDEVAINRDLLEYYRALIHLRNTHPALRTGSFTTLLTDDARRLFAYERRLGEERIVVVLNAGDMEARVSLPGFESLCLMDLQDSTVSVAGEPVVSAANTGRILTLCSAPAKGR
ncbi:MAG: alpha-glucosidase C-terminal domain-containing protein, partial [Calditrichaeota bacterium]|nr:alpha-glucosidase C-terminal domain-containing protein [Calditrichota bacterium]